ncbi:MULTISPECIES: putative signal transducing protein [unclassified Saccharicrinis]|uniref:putative signal transducing protein n=1 Tax=unclassified Saccharicrinis TaxID=2646859 RepID=UPI003D353EB1
MGTSKTNELIEIFAGSSIEAGIVKSLLHDAEIEAFLKDEFMGTIAPWHTSPGGVASVKVVISSLDFESAKIVMEEYLKNQNTGE